VARWSDAFVPPVLAQHEFLRRHADDGPTTVVVGRRRRADPPLSVNVRVRWLRFIHPTFTVVSAAVDSGGCQPVPGGEQAEAARRDPVSAWSVLHPIVQGALTTRVCVVGAESTGKTTLVRAMSDRHATHGVGEYGRDYTIAKKDAGTNDHWTTEDFVRIAEEQQRLEDEAAVGAGPLFFCDTDAMTTALWHERYQGSSSKVVDRLGRMRTYDLFVLCDTDIPWERDGIRLGADTRSAMHRRFLEVLSTQRREPWILVSGSVEQRMAAVDFEIRRLRLLTAEAIYAPTRQHLR
jgi:nicotinamide riboside kinase